MYIFNLCPLPVKGVSQLYSWMALPALKNFPHNEIAFLGAAHQLANPNSILHDDWVYKFAGPKNDYDWESIYKMEVPHDLCVRITDSVSDPMTLLRKMIDEGFQEYRDWLYSTLGEFKKKYPVKAMISFVNCRSLQDVCRQMSVPIVHMEAGFIRKGTWKVSTFQFDFQGVNGKSEAAARFNASDKEGNFFQPEEIANLLIEPQYREIFETPTADAQYEFGIPLQVEDDSNIIAFADGLNNLDTLYRARQIFPPRLLLARNHPLSLMKLREDPNIAQIDQSQNSLEFVAKCKRILTINSSVGFESMLMGRPTYILGDTPLREVAYTVVDRHLRAELNPPKLLKRYLDFIVFHYLISESLWMNKEYIDFRLGAPSEYLIRKRHIEALCADAKCAVPW